MEQRDNPMSLSADDAEVTFQGFGQQGRQDLDMDIDEIGTTPPVHIFAGETDSEEEGSS